MENTKKYYTRLNPDTLKPDFDKVTQTEETKLWDKGINRRNFLKLNAYSIAFAAFISSCKQPVREAIPYLIQPDEIIPSVADYYATTFYDGSNYASLLARVINGRPVKLEGNDKCKLCNGKSSVRAQASILDVYHNMRLQKPKMSGKNETWETVDRQVMDQLQKLTKSGKKLVLLTHSQISPSTKSALTIFTSKWPNTEIVSYDEISYNALLLAHEQCLSHAIIPSYNFLKANYIVGINCDFLSTWLSPVEFAQQYSLNKKDNGALDFNHIQFESSFTVTGVAANKRFPIKPSEEQQIAAALFYHIARHYGITHSISVQPQFLTQTAEIANGLIKNSGNSLVVTGSNQLDTQKYTVAINYLLGNYTKTIHLNKPFNLFNSSDSLLEKFTTELAENRIGGLICFGNDPIYTLGAKFSEQIQKLEFSALITSIDSDTGSNYKFSCPSHTFLESWGDFEPKKGLFSFQQPVIQPIFDSRQAEDILLTWCKYPSPFKNILEETWQKKLKGKFSTELPFGLIWEKLLTEGVTEIIDNNEEHGPKIDWSVLENPKQSIANDIELYIYEANNLGTGNTAFNPWLQELPDSITKISWDNCALMSPQTSQKLKVLSGEYLLVSGKMKFPVYIIPGMPDNTVSISWGYGKIIKGASIVGQSISDLISFSKGLRNYIIINPTIKVIHEQHKFALHQVHHAHEDRLELTKNKTQDVPTKAVKTKPQFEEYPYKSYRWGMVVDLNLCIGCNTCVVACVAENNIPVVGKSEIIKGRSMHWIRVDRYFSGDSSKPSVINIPVMCQHCGNAPCEKVCPVNATSHSSEGINQMVYNRCVGVRYCSVNCPYKTRVFNWFDYNGADSINGNTVDPLGMSSDLSRMALNPDVTSRAKGVMEKCTFCIQRIEEKRLLAKSENRGIADGEIQPACVQSCPTGAIVFGNLMDKNSAVSKLAQKVEAVNLLHELNTLPAIYYIKRN